MLHRYRRPQQVLPLSYNHRGMEYPDYYSKTYKPKRGRSLIFRAILCSGIFSILLFGYWLSTPIIKAIRTTRTPDHESEQYFNLADGTGMGRFPSVLESASLTLSVVVPAYNEEQRMPVGVDEMVAFLKEREKKPYCPPMPSNVLLGGAPAPPCQPFTWEVIIVNDGSKDATAAVAMGYVRREGHERVRLLNLFKNSGKGAAVRKGATRARGQFVLMADADGATKFSDLDALLAEVGKIVPASGEAVAIGSRAHAGGDGSGSGSGGVKRSGLRRFLMWGFHTYMSVMVGGSGIKDTQCGFKLFTRPAARKLFDVLHIERWAFDVELVFLASRLGMPMTEVPVTWHEVGGSKVDLVSDSLKMARDILVIRSCYTLGVWSDAAPSLAAIDAPPLYSFTVHYPSPSPAPPSRVQGQQPPQSMSAGGALLPAGAGAGAGAGDAAFAPPSLVSPTPNPDAAQAQAQGSKDGSNNKIAVPPHDKADAPPALVPPSGAGNVQQQQQQSPPAAQAQVQQSETPASSPHAAAAAAAGGVGAGAVNEAAAALAAAAAVGGVGQPVPPPVVEGVAQAQGQGQPAPVDGSNSNSGGHVAEGAMPAAAAAQQQQQQPPAAPAPPADGPHAPS